MQIEEKFVETKWGKIFYLEGGTGLKTVVFIHGWLGWPVMVKGFVRRFGKEDYKIIAPYLPGHGLSFSLPQNYSFSDLVETMGEFFDKLGIKEPDVLIGHSLGGAIAWKLAATEHEAKKLVLIDPYFKYPEDRTALSIILCIVKDNIGDFFHDLVRDKKEAAFEEMGFGVRRSRLLSPKKIWGMLKMVDVTGIKLERKLPVLVMWGKDDSIVPLADYRVIVDRPNVELVTFDGGHGWFGWHEAKMLKTIENFINS